MGDAEPELQDVLAYWRACLHGDWGGARCIVDQVRAADLLEMFAGIATREVLDYSGLTEAQLDAALARWQHSLASSAADGGASDPSSPDGGPAGRP